MFPGIGMKISSFALLFCALSGGVSMKACATPIDVMAFNVRYGEARDGADSWEHRKDIVVAAIEEYQPDVVGTQECLGFQAEYLGDRLPGYRWFGIGREADGTGEMMAVFFKKNVLIPIEVDNFWLSRDPETPGSQSWGAACRRMVTGIRFNHLRSGEFVEVFNTHFDHLSAAARLRSAKLLAQRAAQEETAAILLGDFNAAAQSSAPWKALIESGFQDAWCTAEVRSGPSGTFHGFKGPERTSKARIDWVLFKGPLRAGRCETVTFNKDGRYPSDHYPIFARLHLVPTKEAQ